MMDQIESEFNEAIEAGVFEGYTGNQKALLLAGWKAHKKWAEDAPIRLAIKLKEERARKERENAELTKTFSKNKDSDKWAKVLSTIEKWAPFWIDEVTAALQKLVYCDELIDHLNANGMRRWYVSEINRAIMDFVNNNPQVKVYFKDVD